MYATKKEREGKIGDLVFARSFESIVTKFEERGAINRDPKDN